MKKKQPDKRLKKFHIHINQILHDTLETLLISSNTYVNILRYICYYPHIISTSVTLKIFHMNRSFHDALQHC